MYYVINAGIIKIIGEIGGYMDHRSKSWNMSGFLNHFRIIVIVAIGIIIITTAIMTTIVITGSQAIFLHCFCSFLWCFCRLLQCLYFFIPCLSSFLVFLWTFPVSNDGDNDGMATVKMMTPTNTGNFMTSQHLGFTTSRIPTFCIVRE